MAMADSQPLSNIASSTMRFTSFLNIFGDKASGLFVSVDRWTLELFGFRHFQQG